MSATAVDRSVPPNIIQAGAGGQDFRSLYKEAVYPVLLAAAARRSGPWQPSRDPFVSNPYRELEIDAAWVKRRKNNLLSGWEVVESHHVNDPTPYDALCKADDVVQAVGEVKAQGITVDHLRQLAVQMDSHQSRRGYLFMRSSWLPAHDSADSRSIGRFLQAQDALGRRIDILDVLETARLWLPLLDQRDDALPGFVRLMADELDRHALAEDRRALARLLDEL